MNLNDYPTPRTDANVFISKGTACYSTLPKEAVYADTSRQLEREAAAWMAVAEMLYTRVEADRYRSYNGVESDSAMEAFDALKAELEKP